MNKQDIITAIRKFIAQRSGIEFSNYHSGDYKVSRDAFMADYRPILRSGRDAKILLAAVSGRDSITAENIVSATRAFCGRLKFVERILKGTDLRRIEVDYTTGQYFPTEYRSAACAVLSTALWDHAEASGYKDGNAIRKWARGEFGRGIADRWFN